MNNQFAYYQSMPSKLLSNFVDCFWMLQNKSNEALKVIVLPDGRIDLFLSKSLQIPFYIMTNNFLGFHQDDLNDFGAFCEKAERMIESLFIDKLNPKLKRQLYHVSNRFLQKNLLLQKKVVFLQHKKQENDDK